MLLARVRREAGDRSTQDKTKSLRYFFSAHIHPVSVAFPYCPSWGNRGHSYTNHPCTTLPQHPPAPTVFTITTPQSLGCRAQRQVSHGESKELT